MHCCRFTFVFNSSFLTRKGGKILCELVTFSDWLEKKADAELFQNFSHSSQKNLNLIKEADIM